MTGKNGLSRSVQQEFCGSLYVPCPTQVLIGKIPDKESN